jgi:quercetin dioxygenase-like cupin family protein/LmbE family N-acetylglucosaminyl deacetylase
MKHLYLSPHLDDVPLSCAGAIAAQRAAGEDVRVVTFFTADTEASLSPLAHWFHTAWDRGDAPYAARRAEDAAACGLLGVDVHHEGLLEAIYRRDADGAPLYADKTEMFSAIDRRETTVVDALEARMRTHALDFGADVLYAPMGLGRHADHQVVIAAARRVAATAGLALRLYEEWPYAAGRFPKERPGHIDETMTFFGWQATPETIAIDIDHRLAVARCYASQIEELFGSDEAMVNEVRAYTAGVCGMAPAERLWRVEVAKRQEKDSSMTIAFAHSRGSEAPIRIPPMGLDLLVRLTPAETGGAFSIIETTNAPGKGPPLHRHAEAEIFRVLEGRYLYQLGDRRFYVEAGDVVSVPGGTVHGFVNVTDAPARQYVIIAPALDAAAFFTELAATMRDGMPGRAALNAFGLKWGVEFLGPPLRMSDQPTD